MNCCAATRWDAARRVWLLHRAAGRASHRRLAHRQRAAPPGMTAPVTAMWAPAAHAPPQQPPPPSPQQPALPGIHQEAATLTGSRHYPPGRCRSRCHHSLQGARLLSALATPHAPQVAQECGAAAAPQVVMQPRRQRRRRPSVPPSTRHPLPPRQRRHRLHDGRRLAAPASAAKTGAGQQWVLLLPNRPLPHHSLRSCPGSSLPARAVVSWSPSVPVVGLVAWWVGRSELMPAVTLKQWLMPACCHAAPCRCLAPAPALAAPLPRHAASLLAPLPLCRPQRRPQALPARVCRTKGAGVSPQVLALAQVPAPVPCCRRPPSRLLTIARSWLRPARCHLSRCHQCHPEHHRRQHPRSRPRLRQRQRRAPAQ